jgi:Flp pilus assembly protein TadG
MAEKRRPMIERLGACSLRFGRSQSGVTAIEFGLLALPFFALVGAILETSLIFISGQVLESALHDSSRLVRTGQTQTGFNLDTFRADMCGRTYGLFGDCSGIFIEVAPVGNFASAAVTPPVDVTCTASCTWTRAQQFDDGTQNSVMMAQAYFRWRTLVGLDLGFNTLADGRRLLGSVALFQNEPFG